MKKLISVILCVVLLLTLCSCGGKKPENMSDAMYQIGVNALNLVDQYINGEITGDTAYDRLEEFYKQANAHYEKEKTDLSVDSLVGTEFANDFSVSFDISMLSYYVMRVSHGYGAMSEVREKRDELAKTLGK